MKRVDTTRFRFKTKAVKIAFAQAAAREILRGAQEIYDRTDKNLSGPKPKDSKDPCIGKMPIPRRTGMLARSLTLTPITTLAYAVWSNPKIAPYAKFVHDGTKKMKARRYLMDVVNERRPAIVNRLRYALKKAIRAEGQR